MSAQTDDRKRGEIVLDTIKSRRVTRSFTEKLVSVSQLEHIVESGHYASSASNRRIHRFLVVTNPDRLRLTQKMSPGMISVPPALIAICTDGQKAKEEGVAIAADPTTWIDVGTAAMNMMIAAQAIGLGACPVTSFSQAGVRVTLGLHDHLRPELLLMLGHPARQPSSIRKSKIPSAESTDWEYIGGKAPQDN